MTHTKTATAPTPEQVAEAFLTPSRPKRRLPLVLENTHLLQVGTPVGDVALVRSGIGPPILLLHGWEGQASDLAAFAPAVIDAGFTVLAMDLPAHGASSGKQTSIPQAAAALHAVAQAVGPLHAVIAHSLGSPVLVEALHAGMVAQRAVLISAPGNYARYAQSFAAAAGLAPQEIDTMLAYLRDAKNVNVWDIVLPHRARQLGQVAALFIHSHDDRVVSIQDSLASASAWPGATHLRVDGLGHRRILSDPAVIAAAIKFVTAETGKHS